MLPKYGKCWQAAIEHVHESCRDLNEDTQSDVALDLMNCFLEMSGHNTYNCASDKKDNLRKICINSMTDRAFMVYTEFYTQTINICWFLRGQVWNEMIAENSLRLLEYLKVSSEKQEELLKAQEKTLHIQEKLLKNEEHLQKFLQNLYTSTEEHYKMLNVLVGTMKNLQSWLIGEVSWFNSITFYVIASFVAYIFTSTKRTQDSRLPVMFLLALNVFIERLFASHLMSNSNKNISELHENYHTYIWYIRDFFICVSLTILCRSAYSYKDYIVENNVMLEKLFSINNDLYKHVKELHDLKNHKEESVSKCNSYTSERDDGVQRYKYELNGNLKNYLDSSYSQKEEKENKNYKINKSNMLSEMSNSSKEKYYLRSRGTTPVTGICI